MNQLNENQIKTRHSHLGPKLSFVGTEEVSEDNFERSIIDVASNVNDMDSNGLLTTLTTVLLKGGYDKEKCSGA